MQMWGDRVRSRREEELAGTACKPDQCTDAAVQQPWGAGRGAQACAAGLLVEGAGAGARLQ